ncbi:hypothetical protein FQN53_002618 [Emmonsiellopsis sp. PD_33]|nr:hypothetical protein FQN53_002618 [Emmonsiellopsis sp. PD_33]
MGWSDLDWVVIRRHGDVDESGLTVLSCGERLAKTVFKEASLRNQFVKTYLQQWAIGGTVGQRLRDLGEHNEFSDQTFFGGKESSEIERLLRYYMSAETRRSPSKIKG